jgi:hypothetical protein
MPPPGDNFTPSGQSLLLGDNFATGGQRAPLGAKLRMDLCRQNFAFKRQPQRLKLKDSCNYRHEYSSRFPCFTVWPKAQNWVVALLRRPLNKHTLSLTRFFGALKMSLIAEKNRENNPLWSYTICQLYQCDWVTKLSKRKKGLTLARLINDRFDYNLKRLK